MRGPWSIAEKTRAKKNLTPRRQGLAQRSRNQRRRSYRRVGVWAYRRKRRGRCAVVCEKNPLGPSVFEPWWLVVPNLPRFFFAPWRLGVRFSLISSLRGPGVRSSVLGKCCSAQPVHDRFANTDLGHWLNIDSLQRQLVEFSKQRKKPGSRLGQIAVLAQ
jgi:hypothetical protein